MAEAADELGAVESVCALLHATHEGHLAVHLDETIFGDLNLKLGRLRAIRVERVLVKLDGEWF